MKKLSLIACLFALTASLTSCGAIAESIFDGIFSDDDDETSSYESREKQERRALYRSEGKPTLR